MPTENRLRFAKTRLMALPLPESARAYYYDLGCPNLQLCITPAGCRTFYRYGKIDGRPVRVLLGRFPETTVDAARKACSRVSGTVADGKDPHADRQAIRHQPTVGHLFAFWLDHAKQRKKTWREDERQYNTFLRAWGTRRLSAVKNADVAALHAKVGHENGRYAANRLLALIRAMFNKAMETGFTDANPAAGVKRFPEEKRDRFLRADELPAFFRSLTEEPNTTLRDFFFVCLLTGARRGNVQAMRWDEVDFTHKLWRIGQTKTGKPVVVPLVEPAVKLLRGRQEAADGNPWVFPTRSATGHLTEPKAAWRRICKRAGLEGVRIHDVRRTLASWMAMGGAGLPVVGKLLGHSQPSTTAIYARLETGPVRAAAETAIDAIFTAGRLLPPPK